MQWFRDGKYGMFIHWGPCTIGQKEIGWGREGNRPWDINKHGPRTSDPEYDEYYKQFNPEKFDADALVKLAKASGMKYMVLVTKHHDGFSMFDTKMSDYSIMHAPYKRDIVKAFADACHRNGMPMGLYYSTRDWYHPDYLVGDNKKYDAWYRAQIKELLTNYGKVDVLWFDHVGGRDWSKWRFDDLFSMMYDLQPEMLVNNRAAKFCGPSTPEDKGPATKEIAKMTKGDYYTPEGRIGSMDIYDDWESCIHIGKGWSYRGEEEFQSPDKCIKMLVSCTTGGGNLLLNVGPRPDGTLADGELRSVKAVGAWLEKYGDAIYGTRGGPYKNGKWGGSCHKGNKLYLHVYEWPEDDRLSFDPMPRKIIAARTLDGANVEFSQTDDSLSVAVAKNDQVKPVTVIELTMNAPIEPGTLLGHAKVISDNMSEFGDDIGGEATLTTSSSCQHDQPSDHSHLFRGNPAKNGYAFHTDTEENPWAVIDLKGMKKINAVLIENRSTDRRSEGLILSISKDGKSWEQVWQAPDWQEKWLVTLGTFHAGINVPGREARYVRVETKGSLPRPLILQRMTFLGEDLP